MCTVPRILVADDNSNIHRTVSLALKDAGVEVVAVGNGEAAVRKMAEIKPDLVLADIFMPVRSGYEVCEFVKHDPRFSHTPVVLLIGAFDPFDEREAQRVQADGILKKPFVPPDSLLRMVADLLAQSAARMAPVAVTAGAAKTERSSMAGSAASAPETESTGFMDAPPEEIAPAKARLEWNAGEQPVAFSTLLESPFADTEEPVVTARRDPTLGEPAFWTEAAKPEEEQEEFQAEESQESEPQRSGDEGQWGPGSELELLSDEVTESAQTAASEAPAAGASPVETRPELPELDASPSQTAEQLPVAPGELLPDLPSLATLPALKTPLPAPAADSAAVSRHEVLPTIPGFEEPASGAESKSEQAPELPELPELKDFSWATPGYASSGIEQESALKSPASPPINPASPGLAALAPIWPATGTESWPAPDAEERSPFRAGPQGNPGQPESAVRPNPASVSASDSAAIEAVVLRVIDRMQPKIIELVTRELLRPVVEALVQRELEKK
jgi:CheY-like chemotaxis protein